MAAARLHVGCKLLPFQTSKEYRYCGFGNSGSSSLSVLPPKLHFKLVSNESSLLPAKDVCGRRRKGVISAAYVGRGSVTDQGYDIYELLGVEPGASLPEVKQAYRWLQKRCHPDIAGPVGHDMAILLNDAYTTLTDPIQRAAYDLRRMERAAFEGFTGEPLYSKWLGPAQEDRAVFVDETQCVGCLKCALIASNTFAIENRYGRARAVGQWGDSEGTIKDAIRSCPVDCISFVGREQLPALEFVMSKQPRVIVGVDTQSNRGQRTENVFVAAEKFLKKCAEREQAKKSNLQETARQKEARMAAAENIQARSGRWWHHFIGKVPFPDMPSWTSDSARASRGAIIPLSWVPVRETDSSPGFHYKSPVIPDELGSLFEEATRRRRSRGTDAHNDDALAEEDYWSPLEPVHDSVPSSQTFTIPVRENSLKMQHVDPRWAWIPEMHVEDMVSGWFRSFLSVAPVLVSVTAACFAGMTSGMDAANSSEVTNVSGPLPAEVTSGVFMQMFLAAAVWYMISAAVCSLAMVLAMSFVIMRQKKQD